ncbi:general L-amino acid transport system permease protein [Albidovulum inexpectatum]|uniref:General L-amino acid transport system permease protein n=1 Tax=Albidovulum inexpectatum TaxID=196587 RepID=A0A2S5JG11_9RHOB|nr:amino acid ABC transporter permease [Albidovulum inexpectatum]PPB80413.1 general L-amino acid transport system permease protein [Albidovulum inexpectatum]
MSDTHAQTELFVRHEMIPPSEPPALETGAIKWLRENLFSGWLNTILTILGLLVVFGLARLFLPWFLHGVWNANSLGECREIIAQTWGPDASGACWAMIRERWNQFMFGFYPRELYWRPVLALLFLLVGLAPVLYSELSSKLVAAGAVIAALIVVLAYNYGVWLPVGMLVTIAAVSAILDARGAKWPRNLLWFSALYPAVAFWLLWGGSVWLPFVAVLGFVLGFIVMRLVSAQLGAILGASAGAVAAVLWWSFGAGPLDEALIGMTGTARPFWLQTVTSDQFGGFVLAFTIGVTGIAASLPLGILLALGRRSDMPLVKVISVGFIEFIRGVPLITLLFVASLLLNYFLPPGTNFDIILRVIIMVTLFAAAYIAEVIRGGLAALPRGQYEAAAALGLDYWKSMRLVILPQALKISIPGIVSTFIGLFKDTTLVVFVGLLDPLKGITDAVRAAIEWKGIYWEPYLFVGSIFFIVCFSMSRYSMYLENKLKREHR